MGSRLKIEDEEFNRKKIYEKLQYQSRPLNYLGKMPWEVQQRIAETNGIHYTNRVGKLKNYPVYELPVPDVKNGLMLDIGTGWGRWLVAGAKKGYIPIGIDIRIEFCETSLATLKAHNKNGYVIVADLKNLPFKSQVFNLVWSFSVIQHTHKQRMLDCLQHINRILKNTGYAFLEFPNKHGIKNRFKNVPNAETEKNNYNSWVVRYYSISTYKKIFEKIFGNFKYKNHSLIGIGILKEDLKYVSFKNKILCGISLLGSLITKIIPGLSKFSDSIYIKAFKNKNTEAEEDDNGLELFKAAHKIDPGANLNVIHILRCPVTGGALNLSTDKLSLISIEGKIKFPIINNIPILIESEATSL